MAFLDAVEARAGSGREPARAMPELDAAAVQQVNDVSLEFLLGFIYDAGRNYCEGSNELRFPERGAHAAFVGTPAVPEALADAIADFNDGTGENLVAHVYHVALLPGGERVPGAFVVHVTAD